MTDEKLHHPTQKIHSLRVLLYVCCHPASVLITLYPYFVTIYVLPLKSRAEIYATKGTLLPVHWLWSELHGCLDPGSTFQIFHATP